MAYISMRKGCFSYFGVCFPFSLGNLPMMMQTKSGEFALYKNKLKWHKAISAYESGTRMKGLFALLLVSSLLLWFSRLNILYLVPVCCNEDNAIVLYTVLRYPFLRLAETFNCKHCTLFEENEVGSILILAPSLEVHRHEYEAGSESAVAADRLFAGLPGRW